HRRGDGHRTRRRPVRQSPLAQAARRLPLGRRLAAVVSLRRRAGAPVDRAGRADRALGRRLRARVVDRPGDHRRDGARHPPARPAPSQPRVDSLAWTVQLAAYARLDRALALADRLTAERITPFITPVTLGPRRGGTVWYRVLAGGYRTRDSAVAVRATLWNRRLAQRGQGDVLRAPYSYAVSGTTPDELRARGIPALARDGDGRLLVGALETPEQGGVL